MHLKQRLLASRCSTKKTKTPFQKTTKNFRKDSPGQNNRDYLIR